MSKNLRLAAVLSIGVTTLLGSNALRSDQPNSTNVGAVGSNGNVQGTAENRSWIARDPMTGRLYQQELVNVSVPTTQWEVKPVPTTVYEPKSVVKTVPSQQTVFTPSTQYVMQPRIRGWWNPLRAPVQTYEFVPVTSWQPQTQTVQNQVATIEWTPRQQVVYVPQPVQKMQTHQQIVSKELPQPTFYQPSGIYPPPPQSMLAAQPRPLVTIPILAQQRILPSLASSGFVNSGLRPIANSVAPNYSAPLQTASSSAVANTRDLQQTGMSATILR